MIHFSMMPVTGGTCKVSSPDVETQVKDQVSGFLQPPEQSEKLPGQPLARF